MERFAATQIRHRLLLQTDQQWANGLKIFLYEGAERAGGALTVEIFYINVDPLWVLLTKMWSSDQLCVATWDGMYCCFPESLINRKAIRFFVCSTPGQHTIRDVYQQRNYRELPPEESFGLDEFAFTQSRWIGDKLSLRIGFSTVQHGACKALEEIRFGFDKDGVMVYR